MAKEYKFLKMHGAENDFVVFNDIDGSVPEISDNTAAEICDRKNGVGADGILIFLKKSSSDFHMRYLNSDGSEGSMCGNGARCLVKLAEKLFNKKEFTFTAPDGEHRGWIEENSVKVSMLTDSKVKPCSVNGRKGFVIDTGAPHFVTDLLDDDLKDLSGVGKELRYSKEFKFGANIDFIKIENDNISVCTYERGVEALTMACGTGAVAVALTLRETRGIEFPTEMQFPGGLLTVHQSDREGEVILEGAVRIVYSGNLSL
ncbi:MAG: diaminopimelate epimerase [Candidatus Marinimicrobia bacterium]|nr:diaminopimelate epimerase [Candidatus Neomarinimicrobiota bacterium]